MSSKCLNCDKLNYINPDNVFEVCIPCDEKFEDFDLLRSLAKRNNITKKGRDHLITICSNLSEYDQGSKPISELNDLELVEVVVSAVMDAERNGDW